MYVLLKACDKEGRQAFVVKKAAFQPDKIFWSEKFRNQNYDVVMKN